MSLSVSPGVWDLAVSAAVAGEIGTPEEILVASLEAGQAAMKDENGKETDAAALGDPAKVARACCCGLRCTLVSIL